MAMSKAYTNEKEGFCCCIWDAPSREALEGLFESAGVTFGSMIEVSEYTKAG